MANVALQEVTPAYVNPDEREQLAAAGLAAARALLQDAGYPGLACDLEAALAKFKRWDQQPSWDAGALSCADQQRCGGQCVQPELVPD